MSEKENDGIAEVLGVDDGPEERLADQLIREGWNLGEVLRRRREHLGFSRDEVAEKVGTTSFVIASAEHNPSSVRLRDIFVMCMSLGLELHLSTNEYDAAVTATSD